MNRSRPPHVTLGGNLDTNRIARCNLHDNLIPCAECTLRRLRQPKKRGEQLRLLPAAEMPRDAVPLENDLVERLRAALAKMGYLTWSGRVAVYDPSPEAAAERAARGWPPFIPSLEPGCPDVLGIFPGGSGRFFGAECKRAESDKERASQKKW